MQRFVDAYPELKAKGLAAGKHVALMGEIAQAIEQRREWVWWGWLPQGGLQHCAPAAAPCLVCAGRGGDHAAGRFRRRVGGGGPSAGEPLTDWPRV